MRTLILKGFPILVILITLISVQSFLRINFSSLTISWLVDFSIIFIIFLYKKKLSNKISIFINRVDLNIITIYFAWVIFNSIRGAFIINNYWELKQLITGILSLSLPIFLYPFTNARILNITLKYWFKYAIILFIILTPFLMKGAYHLFLAPLFLISCFLPILPKKWKIICVTLLVTMLFIDLSARSQVIKSGIVLLFACGIYAHRFIPNNVIKIIHGAFYIIPIVLLYLGISGTFNIFEDLSSYQGKYVEKKVENGEFVEEDLSTDTRTFIYVEVIESALKHNYVICGRTPARGNDTIFFEDNDMIKTGKNERFMNETCHTNIFTWLGLIGVVLYSLLYFRASYLSIYKSNNIYIKFLGLFIAFRWAYGWIEDVNNFNILGISIWMLIAMGLSNEFRLMNNKDFKKWLLRCLSY